MKLSLEELNTVVGWYRTHFWNTKEPVSQLEIDLCFKFLEEYSILERNSRGKD